MARASSYLASAFEDPPEEGVDYPEESSLSGRRRLSVGQAVSANELGSVSSELSSGSVSRAELGV